MLSKTSDDQKVLYAQALIKIHCVSIKILVNKSSLLNPVLMLRTPLAL